MISQLTVSIVLYKTPVKQLHSCLSSLRKFSGSLHLYLVDNSPTDLLIHECRVDISHEYIHLPENPGFGTGHNVAIKKAQELGFSYHLVLNADVTFNEDILTPMLVHLESNPTVGQIMPKVHNPDGSIQRLCKLVPTPTDLFLRRFSTKKQQHKGSRHFELHDSGYDKIMFVPYLSGCFMLLRQSSLLDIGLFDERFFMYPEDIDLTRRMAEHYDTVFFPQVSIVHEYGAGSHKSIKLFLIHFYNLCKYFNKWGWIKDPIRVRLNKKTLSQFINNKH
jgi:GT2 family glycosyltransferase